jgi:hypothetical protein
MDVARLRGFADSLSSSRRVTLDVAGLAPDAVFPPPVGRVMLNLVLMAAESLPGGGTVALFGSPQDNILVTISGPRAGWPPGLAALIADEAVAGQAMIADPRRLQAPLTALLVRGLGLRLSILMPAGPTAAAGPPPLLLSLRTE